MDEVVPRTLDALLAGTLPDPTTLARDLGPLAADRRLQMWSADPPAQQLLDQVGLSEAIPALDGREGWAVALSNAGGNRLDGFLVPVDLVSVHRRPGQRHGDGDRFACDSPTTHRPARLVPT